MPRQLDCTLGVLSGNQAWSTHRGLVIQKETENLKAMQRETKTLNRTGSVGPGGVTEREVISGVLIDLMASSSRSSLFFP